MTGSLRLRKNSGIATRQTLQVAGLKCAAQRFFAAFLS